MDRTIQVFADWFSNEPPRQVGELQCQIVRGKEVVSFEYISDWLSSPQATPLDPGLRLFRGRQYADQGKPNFGIFLDSSPDRWGRVLMLRREAQEARRQSRPERALTESDFLLGVHDGYRMGALRFQMDGPFLDNRQHFAAPPWTSLRELEQACSSLEKEKPLSNREEQKWLNLLLAPGGSLGGARPKASVVDQNQELWIAKFPSRKDDVDVGLWERVVYELGLMVGLDLPECKSQQFASTEQTFLSKRFDRKGGDGRIHFASAMTLLDRNDGDDASTGVSYLDLAEWLIQFGSDTAKDLHELWRRQVFSCLVSNTDDHLRNHGFLLQPQGWKLAPAYDVNPNPQGAGLKLNISEWDNVQDFDLLVGVAPYYRIKKSAAEDEIRLMASMVGQWRSVAKRLGAVKEDVARMKTAFRCAAEWK
jgi:serine/threonine-protein kinase HipA